MEHSKFYNTDEAKVITFLEFGSINITDGKKAIWDFRLHQEAYDFFMLARYMKDQVWYRKLTAEFKNLKIAEQLDLYEKNIFTQDFFNSFNKLAALHVLSRKKDSVEFLELGSTLMGCIEALEYLQALGQDADQNFSALDLRKISFNGIDISGLLNQTAKIIHPLYKVSTYTDRASLNKPVDFFFAKGVSLLYAIRNAEDLFNTLQTVQFGFFDFSFALESPKEAYLGTGKKVVYFPLNAFLALTQKGKRRLFIEKGSAVVDKQKGILRANFYYGEPSLIAETVEEDFRLRKIVAGRLAGADKSHLLLGSNFGVNYISSFIEADEHIES